jgi:membrane protease YdiL (CAAX protease family)
MADDGHAQDEHGAEPDGQLAGADRIADPSSSEMAASAGGGENPQSPDQRPTISTAGTLRGRLAAHAISSEPPPRPPTPSGPVAPDPGSRPPATGRPYSTSGPWPAQAGSTWQAPPAPSPSPSPWPAQGGASWPGPWSAQTPGAWPGQFPGAWPGQFPGSPGQYPGAWPGLPGPIPVGYVPWGFTNPPAVPPVLLAPGRFHPPTPRRPGLSTRGRAAPRLYAVGLALGLPGILAFLFLEVAPRAGWKLGIGATAGWILVETICAIAAIGLIVAAVAQSRQRRADGWRDYAGPSPFLVMGALLAVVTGFGLPLQEALKGAGVDPNSAQGVLLLLLVYLAAYIGLVHFLAVRPGALTWRDIVRPGRLAPDPDDWNSSTPPPNPGFGLAPGPNLRTRVSSGRVGDILMPLAMLLPIVVASSIVNQTLLLVLGLHASDLSSPVSSSSSGADAWIAVFAVAVVVPIGEEVFFRGFAANAWGRSLGRSSAILRAALFFAFIHVINVSNTDPGLALRAAAFNFGARIPVAIALTWLYYRRRSLLASGTLHGAFNGLIQLVSMLAS